MSANPGLDLVRLSFKAPQVHIDYTKSNYKSYHPLPQKRIINGSSFWGCDHFSNQNHITYKNFYEDNVWPYVEDGKFMEHQLFCAYATHPHLKNRMRFLGDENEEYLSHLDGRHAS
jgi:hypothetical protein